MISSSEDRGYLTIEFMLVLSIMLGLIAVLTPNLIRAGAKAEDTATLVAELGLARSLEKNLRLADILDEYRSTIVAYVPRDIELSLEEHEIVIAGSRIRTSKRITYRNRPGDSSFYLIEISSNGTTIEMDFGRIGR